MFALSLKAFSQITNDDKWKIDSSHEHLAAVGPTSSRLLSRTWAFVTSPCIVPQGLRWGIRSLKVMSSRQPWSSFTSALKAGMALRRAESTDRGICAFGEFNTACAGCKRSDGAARFPRRPAAASCAAAAKAVRHLPADCKWQAYD